MNGSDIEVIIFQIPCVDVGPTQKVRTRHKSGDVGAPTDLPDAGALFVNKDIIAAVDSVMEKSPNISAHGACIEVTKNVIQKFMDLNPVLTLLSEKVIINKMKRLHVESVKYKRNKMTQKVKENFKYKLPRLFDIISCQCEIVNCGGGKACRNEEDCTGFHILCQCPLDERIPEKDVKFVKDQREKMGLFGGEMVMEGKDIKEAKLQKE